MVKEPVQKITAFKELLKIAEEGSFDIYETSGGTRSWPVECLRPLCDLIDSKTMTRQKALDETLLNLTRGDLPKTLGRMEKEKKVIHLLLVAGANPNYSKYYSDGLSSVFDSFRYRDKTYGMLELAQDNRFESPQRLQEFYNNFHWAPIYCGFSDEELRLNKQENQNREDLIYALFQKNMYPTNPKVFEKLAPVVLKKDPQFFDKKKQETQKCLAQAKTPTQIYTALMGKRKEKN